MKSKIPRTVLPLKKRNFNSRIFKILSILLLFLMISGTIIMLLPYIVSLTINQEQVQPSPTVSQQFPVSVDPKDKIILQNSQIDSYFTNKTSAIQAAAGNNGGFFRTFFENIAIAISNTSLYENVASIGGTKSITKFVTITPGLRKEQVANAFAKVLGWNDKQKQDFISPQKDSSLPLIEGSFFPSIYAINSRTTPAEAQALVNERFTHEVLSHYGSSTSAIVPLHQALTIASVIQRETIGNKDVRLISGILWNRLFSNMKLQVDATLQYAKANGRQTKEWWPPVDPQDKFIQSPYNTYINNGLPPNPIANPSVTAIVAALNPIKTSCLYYFNDQTGAFHCSSTLKEHTKLIQKYYNQ